MQFKLCCTLSSLQIGLLANMASIEVSTSSPPGPADAWRSARAKASWRLLPLLGAGYGMAYMDRQNISFASLQMNQDLHFSASVYGLGAGLFFVSYAFLELPSNLLLIRFGARRWMARIMLTWGVLATAMMFVHTPMQFYVVRFLLGAAEAGFFPGAVYYLMQWFPTQERGRALSRFYVAWPISTIVMGGLAGSLLGLKGHLGLAGWQWLFLVEGLPAIALGLSLIFVLPDGPGKAAWLTPDERQAIQDQLAADDTGPRVMGDPKMMATFRMPVVWLMGLGGMCVQCSAYALNYSAPAILLGATRWNVAGVGYLVAAIGVLAAVSMIISGWHSDLRRERHLHMTTYLLANTAAMLTLGLSHSAWIVVPAYAIAFCATTANSALLMLVPSDVLRGRSAASGIAVVGAMSMVGGFIGPYAFGIARDVTGAYQTGLLWLALPYALAAAIVLWLWFSARSTASPFRP